MRVERAGNDLRITGRSYEFAQRVEDGELYIVTLAATSDVLAVLASTRNLCSDCRFFQLYNPNIPGQPVGEHDGTCRRQPPTYGVPHSVWPVVGIEDWCGEFAGKAVVG